MNAKEEKELDKIVKFWKRKRQLMGEERWAATVKEVEDRLPLHLLQEPEGAMLSKDILGGQQFFGVAMGPRVPDEPEWMQSKYMQIGRAHV